MYIKEIMGYFLFINIHINKNVVYFYAEHIKWKLIGDMGVLRMICGWWMF